MADSFYPQKRGHITQVMQVAYSPDGNWIASAAPSTPSDYPSTYSVILWHASSAEYVDECEFACYMDRFMWSPDSIRLAAIPNSFTGDSIRVLNIVQEDTTYVLRLGASIERPSYDIQLFNLWEWLDWTPDGSYLVVRDFDTKKLGWWGPIQLRWIASPRHSMKGL